MSSFINFLEDHEDFSQEGQVAKYEKSLEKMASVRGDLVKNGMDATDIDGQMQQVRHALGRRKSGKKHWHGAIIRIDQETRNKQLMWRLSNRSGTIFHIPVHDAHGIIKIPSNWQQVPNPKKPMNKFIEYREEDGLNIITYAENRTVDIVPFRTTKEMSEFYLIKRRDSGLWATVGGHIEEGELENPILAARRELHEETGAYPMIIKALPCGWLRESVSNPELNPPKEFNSWSLPFIALVHPDTKMVPQDDAIDGNFFQKDYLPSLHFSFHKKVIQHALEYLPTLLSQFGKHN